MTTKTAGSREMTMKTAIFALLMAAGCGTLVNDDNSTVTVTAPEDTKILVDGMQTPAGEVQLSNRKPHTITALDKDGKVIGSCQIDTTVMGRYIVADVFLGLIPLAIDAFTSGWTRLDKTTCAF